MTKDCFCSYAELFKKQKSQFSLVKTIKPKFGDTSVILSSILKNKHLKYYAEE